MGGEAANHRATRAAVQGGAGWSHQAPFRLLSTQPFGAFINPLEAKSFCLQLPITGTGSQCEAGVRAPLQLGAQPHTLQSSEQDCRRVRGWAGHGSCAVGWGWVGQGGPIKPPFGAFSNPLEAKSFCLQLPFTGTGSQCEAGVSLELPLRPQPHTLQFSD